MAETLTLQGRLETVPELLRTLMGNQGNARLHLEKDGAAIDLYFEDGRILHASSTDPDLGLAEALLCRGELTLDQYIAIQDLLKRRISFVEALTETGALSPDELLRAFEVQAQAIVQEAVGWTSGTYLMQLDEQPPADRSHLRLNTERLVIRAIRGLGRYSIIRRGLGSFHRAFVQRPDQGSRIYRIELTDEESHVLSLLETPHTIHEVCGLSYLPNFDTVKILWALWVIRLLEETRASGPRDEKRNDEYALSAMLESYNNAFARIHEIVFQEMGEGVEDFMAGVHARLSAENRRFLEGSVLSEEGRLDYDTLMIAFARRHVADAPAALADLLNEILYAWVFEVRLRFGEALQAEVDKAVNEIREE
jgi:hypothetical protein